MDRGFTIENPYASVTLPRAQLKDDFLGYYLGEDSSPGAPQKEPDPKPPSVAWNGQAQAESQARPTNPYASLRVPKAGAPEPFRWKSHEEAATDPGHWKSHEEAATDPGRCGCCGCWPCCRKCCCSCVIS